jgi:hypothetical protein
MASPPLPPGERFSPDYYASKRYVIDPATGRIVEEGSVGQPSQPVSIRRYANADISTVGLGGPASGDTAASAVGGPGNVGGEGAGAEGRVGSETPATGPGDMGDIDAIGGFSTVLGVAGMLSPVPGLGVVGSGIDTVRDKMKAEEFDPEYEGDLGKWGGAFISDLTSGLLGTSHKQRAIDEYQDRTGTGLNDAALGATGKGSYSGPKGVVGNKGKTMRDKARGGLGGGGQAGEGGGADQGHGGGGQLGGDRDKGFGGPR